ncbi:2-amino-4-hydroxy-6-hydroxymethyldihydropteridine diphosphokinase [Moraxella oblonga]|uniref:2-amino-4-hydroxy-6- hydroxymethyldihydropteridine diphosphokinase n=1 Tax=Moraxella oblonga TaxID=200413 RepID=UPI000836C1E6|nr:2-amino-4-hydroxy-6-hydroxymethyldihydropteridine diphosphokinase [Moraxella oblonga]
MDWTTCYIGLGGNIANEHGTPKEHLKNAINAFKNSEYFKNVATSSLYSSKAYGVTDQPDFINAVLKADTNLAPLDLLDFCQNLENRAGRVRLRHWGERCLDVDILLYGNHTIQNDRLTVPHQEILLRNFVLVPLLELDDTLIIHGQKINELTLSHDMKGLTITESL